MSCIFFYFIFGLQKYLKSNFSNGLIYKLGKEIIDKLLQNEIVHNHLLEEQFFSEPVLFLETALVAASKKPFESFTWNVTVFIRKNFRKSS